MLEISDMERDKKLEILTRYTTGTVTTEEKEMVENWFEAIGIPAGIDEAPQQDYLDRLYVDIHAAIHADKAPIVPLQRRFAWRPVAAAAALLIFLLGAWLLWPAKPPQLAVFKAPANHLRFLQLPDGSSVWLNASSKLSYPSHFGKTREVELSGEAYFDVKHDASHPFLIHTETVVTTVLGTAFDIKEDAATQRVTVTVKRGKVSVANGQRQLAVLLPDQQVSVDVPAEKKQQRQVDATQVASWRGGDLYFDNVTFADAARQLEQRFAIKILFSNDRLKSSRFSATASGDDTLDKIITNMCAFNHARFSRQPDGTILISDI